MPVFTYTSTDVILELEGEPVRLWTSTPTEAGEVHCVLVAAADDTLEAILLAFMLHPKLAARLPAELPKYAQFVIDNHESKRARET